MKYPKEWKKSVFIPLPKKGDNTDCGNYRTIALIPHARKILLKIILKRLEQYVEKELPPEQAGFRKERGTRDQIANLRWIMEKYRERDKSLFLCFIDYKKAFDSVNHARLWTVMNKLGIPKHLVMIIKELYMEQEAKVLVGKNFTEWFSVGKGVRQGCILSPVLFNLYSEYIMREARLAETNIGVRVGGLLINNLRYADDTTLLAETNEGIIKLLMTIKNESEKAGLKLNLKKTKIMGTGQRLNIQINGEELNMTEKYNYLGALITTDGRIKHEIHRRITLGKAAMLKLKKVMKDTGISKDTKIKIVRTMVFPVILYGCESWTLNKYEKKRLDAFELWTWRRLLGVLWTDKITNAEILQRIMPTVSLEATATKLKISYFGHLIRRHESLEKIIMLGHIDGNSKRGRRRTRWMKEIQDTMGLGWRDLLETAQHRGLWRRSINDAVKDRGRLNV